MTNYTRIGLNALTSEQSDYSKPFHKEDYIYTLSPTQLARAQVSALLVGAGGTTFDLTNFTTVVAALIANLNTSYWVSVVATDTNGGAFDLTIPKEGSILIYSLDPSANLVLTADTAACTCDIWVWGT